MDKKTRQTVHAAMIAALYVVLTHLQNIILPGSATWAIQCRLSETLCVLAFFTPAAIPGLAAGCFVFNMTYAGALPLDFLVGTLATFLAAGGMWLTRNVTIMGLPVPGLLMPALTNAFLVGGELTVFIGGGFWLNAVYVALGESIVLLTFGVFLYRIIKSQHLDSRMFG
ncbi:MAG: QueT transporter family protein [Oscillospiraceae bacterium]|nr:QueT transporter family protein [Oscillospiraceae bacterium]